MHDPSLLSWASPAGLAVFLAGFGVFFAGLGVFQRAQAGLLRRRGGGSGAGGR